MASDAQKKASAKYDAANTMQFKIKLNKTTDAEIIEHLKSLDNKQGYIKNLILQDIKMNK
jgi:hypothetical protein